MGGEHDLLLGADQRSDGLQELVFRARLAANEMHIVDQQHVAIAHQILEGLDVASAQGGLEAVEEFLRRQVQHLLALAAERGGMSDRRQQVGFAHAVIAMEEDGIERRRIRAGHGPRRVAAIMFAEPTMKVSKVKRASRLASASTGSAGGRAAVSDTPPALSAATDTVWDLAEESVFSVQITISQACSATLAQSARRRTPTLSSTQARPNSFGQITHTRPAASSSTRSRAISAAYTRSPHSSRKRARTRARRSRSSWNPSRPSRHVAPSHLENTPCAPTFIPLCAPRYARGRGFNFERSSPAPSTHVIVLGGLASVRVGTTPSRSSGYRRERANQHD